MKKYYSIIVIVLLLSGCSGQLPVVTAQKWINQPTKKVKKIPKIQGPIVSDEGAYYYVTQKADIPKKKQNKLKDRKTGEVHYEPSSGGGKYEVVTRYYVENDQVISWKIIYSRLKN